MNKGFEAGSAIRLGVLILVVGLPFALAGGVVNGLQGLISGLIVGAAVVVAAYAVAGKVIVRIFDASIVDSTTHPELIEMVERLATRAGIPVPRVAVSRLVTPNAFAAPTPAGGLIGVTEPLLAILDPEEVEAVLAHELAHLMRPGRMVATTAAMFAAIPGALSIRLGCSTYYDIRFRRLRKPGAVERRNQIFGFWCALPAAVVVRLGTSRAAEFEADAGAVELCGGSEQLVSALRKINSFAGRLVSPVNPALAHLLVVHPFSRTPLSRMFDTHPPVMPASNALKANSRSSRLFPLLDHH